MKLAFLEVLDLMSFAKLIREGSPWPPSDILKQTEHMPFWFAWAKKEQFFMAHFLAPSSEELSTFVKVLGFPPAIRCPFSTIKVGNPPPPPVELKVKEEEEKEEEEEVKELKEDER